MKEESVALGVTEEIWKAKKVYGHYLTKRHWCWEFWLPRSRCSFDSSLAPHAVTLLFCWFSLSELLPSPIAPLSPGTAFVVYCSILVSSFCFPFSSLIFLLFIFSPPFSLLGWRSEKRFWFKLNKQSMWYPFFQSAAQYLTIVLFLILSLSVGPLFVFRNIFTYF